MQRNKKSYLRFSFMKKTTLPLTVGLLCVPLASFAQITDADTLKLHDVQVYGTPKAPVELLPLSVSIITSEKIEKSAETNILPVLSNHVPGFFLTERGIMGYGVSNGAAGSVNIRGVGGGNKVLFMIDGQPQWASIFGHALPDTYTSSDVEKVEVVRGPSSLLYGSNAMGGSVNIITKHAKQMGFNGSANLMWGSYATQKYGLNLGYANNKFNAFVSATYESTDGERRNSQGWLASQFASLGYKFSDHWKAGTNVTLTETKPHNPGTVDDPLNDMWTQIFRGTAAVFINNNYDAASGQVQLYTNWGKHKINDGYSANGTTTNGGKPRDYLFHSDDYNMGVNAYQNLRLWTSNVTSVGIDFQHWGGKTWNSMNDGSPDQPGVDKHVNEIAGYLMTQQGFIEEKFSINAGLRYEHSSQFGNILVPQAGVIGRPWSGNTMKFSWGKGFRSPNLRELYMYPPQNPDLKPEYMWNYEVEIRQLFMNGRLDAGLSLFYIDGKDMIQTVKEKNPVTGGQMTNKNIGDFKNKGFELDATYAINSQWSATANYSYLHSTENVLYAPKNKIFGEIMYHPGKWEFAVESINVWRLRTGGKEKENYSLLNGRIGYNLTVAKDLRMNIFCKVDNITATKYETVYGFPMPRTTAMAGFNIRF